ncbi:hypothetical protein E4U53_006054 [Claviceps sorghi]|nr:hypothetical protein E4U53_006054 [Claviceps sorghi]
MAGYRLPIFQKLLSALGFVDSTADESQRLISHESAEIMSRNHPTPRERRDSEVGRTLRSLEKKLDDLPQKFHKVLLENEKELKNTREQADILNSKLKSLKSELLQEIEQRKTSDEKARSQAIMIHQLNKDKKKLREVILSRSTRQEISDEMVKQHFSKIRQQIQAIVHSAVYDVNHPLSGSDGTQPQFVLDFEQRYNSYSSSDRVFLTRAMVFEIVHSFILSKDAFGVESSQNFEDNFEARLEQALGDFEGHLRGKKVPSSLVSEWRLATIKCIETFNPEPKDPTPARNHILNLLEPLLKPGDDHSKLDADVFRLCEDAYHLRLLTRHSHDRYYFHCFDGGINFDPDQGWVEPCGVLGGGETSNVVAFTICGALAKETGKGNENFICLEPAHVVVQARELKELPDSKKISRS